MRTGFFVLCLCFAYLVMASPRDAGAAEQPPAAQKPTATDQYMKLGTPEGVLGGEAQKDFERREIKTQIKTFIPPLLRPAFTQHAFVLPPRTFEFTLSTRLTSIGGDDFFKDGEPNLAVFEDFEVERHLTDFDVFYGFDLGRKYLHGFTLRLNVPYLDSSTDGFIHPNGQPFISIENAGSTQDLGDVGIFLKKKVWDQGTRPFGLAVVGGIFLPTGSNSEKFGSNGRVTTRRPQPANTTVAQGFDALQAANVGAGVWGSPKCFFRNFNLANRALCNGPAAGAGGAFGVPAAGPLSFSPGGANFANPFIGDFPFNNGIFGRFSDDGRLPSVLQPGTGGLSYLVGLFFTRQFSAGDFPGRSAAHLGVVHRFVFENDGIDFGDTTTFFGSFVKPIFKDYVALDLTFVGFHHQNDSYSGKIPEPEIHTCDATDVANGVGGCAAVGAQAFLFELVDRPSFSGGLTGMIAPSLIFSPDPQIRMVLSGLFRVVAPGLGPAPPWVVRFGLSVIF